MRIIVKSGALFLMALLPDFSALAASRLGNLNQLPQARLGQLSPSQPRQAKSNSSRTSRERQSVKPKTKVSNIRVASHNAWDCLYTLTWAIAFRADSSPLKIFTSCAKSMSLPNAVSTASSRPVARLWSTAGGQRADTSGPA